MKYNLKIKWKYFVIYLFVCACVCSVHVKNYDGKAPEGEYRIHWNLIK